MFKEDLLLLTRQNIQQWNDKLTETSAPEVIKFFIDKFMDKICFASSMGAEDQVITEMITAINPSTNIFTLDTGRLFQETYNLIQKTNSRYGIRIDIKFPHAKQVENMVKEKGINLFYDSIANRKLCCHTRKIEPLNRALEGMTAWISGIRREQSTSRQNDQLVVWDNVNKLIKVNPLINWTEDQVWTYIKEKNIPYNKLHDKGYKSIGCLPCTRAVKADEDPRSGRWWWEAGGHKECGLHKR